MLSLSSPHPKTSFGPDSKNQWLFLQSKRHQVHGQSLALSLQDRVILEMSFRFFKSIRLAPGLKLNFGKRGTSLSVGGRGITTNVSSKGTRTTFGIPGTGVSYSTKREPLQGGWSQASSLSRLAKIALAGFLLFTLIVIFVGMNS